MIELIGLNKSFDTVHALNNINLFIQEGEIFGIIGKSGAGKSTLIRSINLLERPDSGDVIIDNQNMMSLNNHDLRKARHKIGMIFQHFNLLNAKTVAENIALPMRIQGYNESDINSKTLELLELVELIDKKNAYPAQLSGGQKQRVAIARALSSSPKILLCDEATSALDPDTTESILQLLQRINKLYGLTIVLITHEMNVIKRICQRLAVMACGQIIELTTLAAAFANVNSTARGMLYDKLSPKLPDCLAHQLTTIPSDKPILRLFFQGETATIAFISKISRELHIDINILLANIDRFDTMTCGVLVIELCANASLIQTFIEKCNVANLTVEILGYVHDPLL